jgi:TonB-dependent receptor
MGFAYNFADAERPRVYTTVGNADDASRFAFQGLTREKRVIEDKDFNLRGNWTMPFGMSSGAGSLKFGAAARLKNRTNNINTTVSTTALGTNSLGATAANLFQTLVGTSAPVRIFDGFYSMGPQAQTKAAEDFINANPGAFTTDQFNSDLPTKGAYFKVKEDVYAGYVMASMDWGSFSLTPGARIEATRLSSDANKLAVSGTTLTATPITNSSTYTNFFPSVTANYRADEHTVFRAAVTTSMARPNFGDIVPSTRTTSGQNTATVGNAALKPTEALNLDLMAEKYFSTVGFVSLGVFHKSLKNFVYPQTRAPQAGEALPAEVTQVIEPVNGPTGTITGLEAAWQQALAFLPGALNGLGVNLNYTWTKSEATFPLRGSEKFSIPGQAGASANAGLSYDKGPLSLRTGLNYASKYRVTVSPVGKDADTYRLPHTQLDFSGSYQLFSNTKVFLEGINLTNEPYRGSVGDRDNRGGGGDDPSFEFYRPWWTLGFRIGN